MRRKSVLLKGMLLWMALMMTACGSGDKSVSFTEEGISESAACEEESYSVDGEFNEGSSDFGLEMSSLETIVDQSAEAPAEITEAEEQEGAEAEDDGEEETEAEGNGQEGAETEVDTKEEKPEEKPEEKKKRKLITTVYVEAETESFDWVWNEITGKVDAIGGYTESSHVSQNRSMNADNSYTVYRMAELTIRIPDEELDGFLTLLSGKTNILDQNRTTEDVTLTYVDIESRKKTYEAQRSSLLRLMEQAEKLEDILVLEERLSEVNYEIERMGGQLRNYDNLSDYATLHLTLREVVAYTPVTKEAEPVLTRMRRGFTENVERVAHGFVEFLVWLVVNLPQLVVIFLIFFAVWKLIRFLLRRRKLKKQKRDGVNPAPVVPQNPNPMEDTNEPQK